MAAPSFKAASTGETDAGGAWALGSTGWGLTCAVNDLVIYQILQDGTTNGALTNFAWGLGYVKNLAGTANAMTQIVGPNGDGSFPIGSAATGRQFLFIGRMAQTASVSPTSTGSNSTSEDVYLRAYLFSDVSTGTTLATVIENSTAGNATNGAGTSTTVSDTAVTTLGPDRLALNFVGLSDDAMGLAAFAGETGGDWTLATAIYEESSGTDATIGLQIAVPAAISQFTESTGLVLNGGSGVYERLAQSFTTVGAVTLSKIVTRWTRSGTAADSLILELQTDSSGAPSGTILDSGTFDVALIASTGSLLEFASTASLSAATKYWIVARRTATTSQLSWNAYSTSDLYAGGGMFHRDSGSWVSQGANWDAVFAVVSTADQAGITIDGGSDSITSVGWGVVGFALIGTTVAYEQQHFRFRNDDGNETTATWMADLDTNP